MTKIDIGKKFTVKKQEIAEEILERYRCQLFNNGKFRQMSLENELKSCWNTGYQTIKQYAHDMMLSPRYRYVALYLMENAYPNIICEHQQYLCEAWGCPYARHPSNKDANKCRRRFWDFFKSDIVPMDKTDKSKLHEDIIIEEYQKQLYSKPHTFYTVGLREKLLMLWGERYAKINPKDVETLMFHISQNSNHPFFYVAIYYLTELGSRYISSLTKVYGSRRYSEDDALRASFWKQFSKDVAIGKLK
jgi:hypothetical protein